MFSFADVPNTKAVLCLSRKDKQTFNVLAYHTDGWTPTEGEQTINELCSSADQSGWFMATRPWETNGYSYLMFVKADELAPVSVLLTELKQIAADHDRNMLIKPQAEIVDILQEAKGQKVTFLVKIEFSAKRYTITHYRIGTGPIKILWATVNPRSVDVSLRCLNYNAPACPSHAHFDTLRRYGWRDERTDAREIKDLYFYNVEPDQGGEHFGVDCRTDLQIFRQSEQGMRQHALAA